MSEQTPQQRMKAKLESLPFPKKRIEVYGRQIVITCHSVTACKKWAGVVLHFAKVRGVVESVEDAKENKGTCLLPTKVKVASLFAVIE